MFDESIWKSSSINWFRIEGVWKSERTGREFSFQGGRNIGQSAVLQSWYDGYQGASRPGLPPLRWHGVCRRATARQRHHVAQEVFQLCRMPSAFGLYAGLRRTRPGNSLPILLRQALWAQRIWFRAHADSRFHQRRSRSLVVSIASTLSDRDLSSEVRSRFKLKWIHRVKRRQTLTSLE